MRLQEKLKKDLTAAMKEKNEAVKSTLRVVLGEFQRSEKKELEDDEVIRVLKKMLNNERETLAAAGQATSDFIRVIESYLPRMASEAEIEAWIKGNIDFSAYKNKMQAMRDIMAHFGANAEGTVVKAVLERL